MYKKSSPKKKKTKPKGEQTLSYPIVLRGEGQEKAILTLQYLKKVGNNYLRKYFHNEILELLEDREKKAYKLLEPQVKKCYKKAIASRINRGMLEVTGRILRAVSDRKNLFDLLVASFGEEPKKWSYKKLIEEKGIYVKTQYVVNLREQVENFYDAHGQYPQDFFAFQRRPKLRNGIISFAPDDGQAIKIERYQDYALVQLKLLTDIYTKKWEWVDFYAPLPALLRSYPHVAPDLRLACVHGQWLPLLDFKVQLPCPKKQKTSYFLTVDWGTRKLLTLCIFDRQGHLLCPPIFLKFEPVQKKLKRIRQEISKLKSARDKLPKHSSLWKKYNRLIAQKWRKFRAIQKELAHLAANAIVLIAQMFGCSEIYVEWLKSLKSKKFSAELNWVINTTVRQAIYDLVAYKAKLSGIELKRPLNPYNTSQHCPHCGEKGYHVRASNLKEKCHCGGWFICPFCGYNADRDFVACCNLARKALYGNNLDDAGKEISYQAISTSDLLFRQSSSSRERLRHHLNGWKEVVTLQPQKVFFCGTLRS